MVILLAAALLVGSAAAFPAFCTRIESGSSVDISSGSLSTTASGLLVTSEGIDPVELSYRISLIGIGDAPAQGSANAYIEGLIVEGRDNGTGIMERLDLSDYTAVNGQITQFEKILQYKSGFVS